MSATDHIKQYSAADIQRYLEGRMLPAEMHALEKAALDDPFLADAIEGMQQTLAEHDPSLIDTHLQNIREQVYERTHKKSQQAPVRAFRWWQAAAAAVIVITGGIWAWNSFLQTENNTAAKDQLAIVKQEKAQDSNPPAASVQVPVNTAADTTVTVSNNLAATEYKKKSELADGKRIPALTDQSTAKQSIKGENIQPAAASDDLAANRQKAATAFARDEEAKVFAAAVPISDSTRIRLNLRKQLKNDNAITSNSKPVDYEQIVIAKTARDTLAQGFYTKPRELDMNRSRKELSDRQAKKNPNALLSGFISGRVTDQANNPLSNALLRVDNNRDFFTDQQGQFKIPVRDSVVNVAVGITGYYTQNLQLQNNTNNNIALNQLGIKAPNPLLNESIQASKPEAQAFSKEYRINYPEVMVQDAQPEYGWMEYQQYLEKNKHLPAGGPELTGKVVVSFQVNRKGLLSDFKIEQSLSKVYDDEAIRLIKAGPSWKLTKGRKAKATVIVHF